MFMSRQNLGAGAVLILLSAGVLPTVAQNRIIFTSNGPSAAQLFIANADGTGERKLLPTAEMDYSPSFSLDGEWIVFTSERQGSADIYRMHPDGSEPRAADGRSIVRRSSGALT